MNIPSQPARDKLLTALRPNLRGLARRGTLRSYPKNSVIINEGELGDALFVLLQGRVKVYSNDSAGHEITFNFVDHGDYFAEMCFDGGPRSASVMTVEPSVCSVVTPAALRQHMAEEPEFAQDLISQVIRRARSATEAARNMALLDVYGRVVVALQGPPGQARTERPLVLTKITHQNIASRVGASREMVSRLLKDLEKGGYIELGVKRITLLKKLPARW
jgi:CRP/FNR family transcriptional regulator, cyclic AMP receptor protein